MSQDRLNELLEQLQKGHMEFFDEFYERTKRGVYLSAYSILHEEGETENVLQDADIKFLEKLPTLRKDKSVLAYLMSTARNLAINLSKERSRISYELDPSLIPAKEENNDTHVFEVMGRVLTQKEEQIVLMHSIYEMGHKEIAEAIHMPLGSVTWAYNNAIKKLRKELEKDGYQ